MKKDIIACVFLLALIGTLVWGIIFIYKADFSGFNKEKVTETEPNNDETNNETILNDKKDIVNTENKEVIEKENNETNKTDKVNIKNNNKNNNESDNKNETNDKSNNDTLIDNNEINNEDKKENNNVTPIRRLKYMTCSMTIVSDVFDGTETVVTIFDDEHFISSLIINYVLDFSKFRGSFSYDDLGIELQKEFTQDLGPIGDSSVITSKWNDNKFNIVFDTDIGKLKHISSEEFDVNGLFFFDNFYNSYTDKGYLCN